MFVSSKFLSCPHDPCRRPDLRWRRCLYLHRHRRCPFYSRDDDSTRAGCRYLQDRRASRTPADYKRLAERHPDVAAAHDGFRRAALLQRAEVEARLLARQGDEDIATRCGLTAAAVGAYHDLFFRIRDRLNAECYIYNVVIGPKAHAGLTEDDVNVILKLLGYAHGPLMVDLALRYFRNPPALPPRLNGLDAAALANLHLLLQVRLLILTMVTPAHALAAKKQWLIAEPTIERDVSSGHNGSADQSVAAFLREQVRKVTQEGGLPSVLRFDRSGVQESAEKRDDWVTALCG